MRDHASPTNRQSELQDRLIVASIMIPIALLVVWLGGWWLAIACIVGAAVLGAEWASMAGLPKSWFVALVSASPIPIYMTLGFQSALAALWISGFAGVIVQRLGFRRALQTLIGTLYTGGIPFSLLVLRDGSWDGSSAALILMALVWASDSGAFFTGRALRGPLLAPKISPNKTWTGAVGAVVSTALCGVIAAYLLGTPPLRWILFAALLSIVSQFGDLVESQVKRDFGAKDASNLLPGHGGLMDRVDGLGAVCIVAASLFILFPDLVNCLGLGR